MAAPILNLSNLIDKPTIVLADGTSCRMVTHGLLPPLESHRLIKMSERAQMLVQKNGNLTPEEEKELAALPDQMCRIVLLATDEQHKQITDLERWEIVSTFLSPPRMNPPAERGPTEAAIPTGAISSPDSSGSTAAAP